MKKIKERFENPGLMLNILVILVLMALGATIVIILLTEKWLEAMLSFILAAVILYAAKDIL